VSAERPALAALEFGEIACKLAASASCLQGDHNAFRDGLHRVSACLAPATRNLAGAQRELGLLLAVLMRKAEVVDAPETWITCACAALLAIEQTRLAGGAQPQRADSQPS
jgi:hypothetical protein